MVTTNNSRRATSRRTFVTVSVLTAAAAFALVMDRADGAPPPATPPPAVATCAPTDLGTLGGHQGNATAVSSNGLVTGYADDGTGTPQPVLWKSGQPNRIVTGLLSVAPKGINRRGEVVGVGVEPSDLETVGWHWLDGQTTLLRAPAGKIAVPEAINDAGRIAGALAADDDGGTEPSGEAPEQPASWASAKSPATVLPHLAGDVGGHVYGLNQKGVMVGNSQGVDHFTPSMWNASGHLTALQGLGGQWAVARAVDDTGVAVGAAVAANGEQQAMIWDVSHHAKKHGWVGGRGVQANGLPHGISVGQIEVREKGDILRTKAVQWDASGNPAMIPPLPGYVGAGVNAASPDGMVVGFSSDDRDVRRPTAWKCVR